MRFRPQGRDRAGAGLDCVGVAAFACRYTRATACAPHYALRGEASGGDRAPACATSAAGRVAGQRRSPATCAICAARARAISHGHLRAAASSMPMPACGGWSNGRIPVPWPVVGAWRFAEERCDGDTRSDRRRDRDRRADRRRDRRGRSASRSTAQLFAPKPRQGPRLGDLAVQTSTYGSRIPKLFGTMRVAGTVIWATDLIEERSNSGGGKGQPKTVNYSYSANFAVALSARPIVRGPADLGGRQAAARRGRGLQDRDRLPPPSRRRGPGRRSADRGGRGRGRRPRLSRPGLCGVRGLAARRLRQPDSLADLRGGGGSGALSSLGAMAAELGGRARGRDVRRSWRAMRPAATASGPRSRRSPSSSRCR